MSISRVSNIVTGYVNIRVEGFYIERFINICISKKILLHDITREKSTILYAKVGINDYKRLRDVAKKTKSKIKIEGKVGLPFVMHNNFYNNTSFKLCVEYRNRRDCRYKPRRITKNVRR